MYRYKKMVKHFEKIEGFDGYVVDYNGEIKTFRFNVISKETKSTYVIEVINQATIPVRIYKKVKKKYTEIKLSHCENSIQYVAHEIEKIILKCNNEYKHIIPFQSKYEKFDYEITCINLVEEFDKINVFNFPKKVVITCIIKEDKKEKVEIEYTIKNENKLKDFPKWTLQDIEFNKDSLDKEEVILIKNIITELVLEMNKKYRLRHLVMEE